jgi:hypothetical protein
MKSYASLFIVIACLFVLAGCLGQPSQNVRVIHVTPPPSIPAPEIKTFALVVGKTTRENVAAVIGQPQTTHTYSEYNQTQWIYNLPPQNAILDVSATGKDGFTYTYRWPLGKGSKVFSLVFTGNRLSEFSL